MKKEVLEEKFHKNIFTIDILRGATDDFFGPEGNKTF